MSRSLRLAYLGPPGTNAEEAALTWCPDAHLVPLASISAVVSAVESGMADRGVIPIENSLQGGVPETLDVLVHESSLLIRGEVILAIEHYLLAPPGRSSEEVRVIYSHPQALGQCRRFIERCFPRAQAEAALSTAAAVEQAMATEGAAAIATRRAGELYGAAVLARDIQDNRANKTRFVIVAPEDAEPSGEDRTSLAFTVAHDRPGTLVGVLHEFADRGINLTRIESRPSQEELGIYVFLIDLDGHRTDPAVADALKSVAAQASTFKVLGSYPRWGGQPSHAGNP